MRNTFPDVASPPPKRSAMLMIFTLCMLMMAPLAGCATDRDYIEADAATEAVIGPKFEAYTHANTELAEDQRQSDLDTLETWRLRIRKAQAEQQPAEPAKPVNQNTRERLGTFADRSSPATPHPTSYEEPVMAKAKTKTKPKADPAAEQFNVAIEAMPHVFKQAHDYADVHAKNNSIEGAQCHEAAKADEAACVAALSEARDFCKGSQGPALRTRLESMESKLKPVFDKIQHVGARRSVWKLWHTIHSGKF